MGIETALAIGALAASTVASTESQNQARRQSNQAANGAAQDQEKADKALQAQTLQADEQASAAAIKARQRGVAGNYDKQGTVLTSPLGAAPAQTQTQAKTLLGL